MTVPPDGTTPTSGERYVHTTRIATGGMGEVWRARDTVLGREVAVKILKQEYADDATFRARFEAEARHAAGLHHAGIASVFDYGVLADGRTPFLVMELVDGRPLSDLLAEGRAFDPEQTRVLVAQAAEALGAAHAAGLVHRDVKPANLMVTPDGRIKVTDFGIARAADSVPITMTGQIIGTPHYLSPEQARGDQATARSDVYALGVVLFECLTGHRPFSADSPVATALAHVREDVPDLPDSVPADLAAAVHRAMAKDPAARYADGNEFAAALRGRSEQRIIPPVPVPDSGATQVITGAAAPVAVAAASGTETGPVGTPTGGAPRWPWIVAGLLALLIVVLLLVTRPWEGSDTADNMPPTPSPTKKSHPAKKPSKTASGSPTTPSPTEKPTRTESPTDTPSETPTTPVPSVTVTPGSNGNGQGNGQGNKHTTGTGSSPSPSVAPKVAPSPPASAGASAGSGGQGG